MGEIMVTPAVHERITLLARAWDITEGKAVERLLNEFQQGGQRSAAHRKDGLVPVHAVYDGIRTDALFDPGSEVLEITSGPLAGERYKSPSGAATAVVQAANPQVHPNRNGWSFWAQSDNGETLQMIRRKN